jgi:hypothetical protein
MRSAIFCNLPASTLKQQINDAREYRRTVRRPTASGGRPGPGRARRPRAGLLPADARSLGPRRERPAVPLDRNGPGRLHAAGTGDGPRNEAKLTRSLPKTLALHRFRQAPARFPAGSPSW